MFNDNLIYSIVVNSEEQYSIWPNFKSLPKGWSKTGFEGPKESCLSHIQEIWKDMRPLSLRKKMEERKQEWDNQKKEILAAPSKPQMSETVAFLSTGFHPLTTRPSINTVEELNDSIQKGIVHLTFTDTRGKTCLAVKVDPQKVLDPEKGILVLEGKLVLDMIPVRCLAEIHLPRMEGRGRLEIKG